MDFLHAKNTPNNIFGVHFFNPFLRRKRGAQMAGNSDLRKAKAAMKDEFYTQLSDIENELRHYKNHFSDKTVFCNCDDPYESSFFKYFALNFNILGLKKLIATCYDPSPVAYTQLSMFPDIEEKHIPNTARRAYKIEITEVEDFNRDGTTDMVDVDHLLKNKRNAITLLDGNGDFRSAECVELLKEADIVVTNPPFSLFRVYVAQLIEYDKKFIIVGNQNAITYKEIFRLIKANKLWLGYGFSGNAGFFINKHYVDYAKSGQHREGMIRVSGVMWFTNLEIKKRYEDFILYKKYTPELYPKYANYDAIEVSITKNIPCDYYGVMGVPITYLEKHNPDQFEIIGATESEGKGLSNGLWDSKSGIAQPVVNGVKKYKRLFIRRKI